jgi:hypothetical protein
MIGHLKSKLKKNKLREQVQPRLDRDIRIRYFNFDDLSQIPQTLKDHIKDLKSLNSLSFIKLKLKH